MNRSLRPRLNLGDLLRSAVQKRGLIFGVIILGALLAFEVFNYTSTQFSLHDILGDIEFAGVKWATGLAVAFCLIDFAGIARIFTPEQGRDEPAEVWYLFAAWLLAAAFNATLTWWGVSVAILQHQSQGGVLIGASTMTKVVPVFVAVMVLMIRVLLINTFSIAGERIFPIADDRPPAPRPAERSTYQPVGNQGQGLTHPHPGDNFRE